MTIYINNRFNLNIIQKKNAAIIGVSILSIIPVYMLDNALEKNFLINIYVEFSGQ